MDERSYKVVVIACDTGWVEGKVLAEFVYKQAALDYAHSVNVAEGKMAVQVTGLEERDEKAD